jgi:DNA-binding transcriptional MerR regulator
MLRIGELARIAGVTPRLLRHYEAVGVLAPAETNSRTGYRYYTHAQVGILQRALAYREAGVPLPLIARLLQNASQPGLLERQRERIVAERAVLDHKLALLDAELRRRASRPFRIKRTERAWATSVRCSVATYADADALVRDLPAPSAAVWHLCRPDEGRIDCEIQVVFPRPASGRSEVPSRLVVSYVHTGPDEDLPAIYKEMHRWSRAARYRCCGPLREVYWGEITEVQFPVQ